MGRYYRARIVELIKRFVKLVISLERKEFGSRLAQLRMQKGVSAREMSLAIGQHKNYINTIENGKTYPSMQSFFYICEYLSISPEQFFHIEIQNPRNVNKLSELTQSLSEDDLGVLISVAEKLRK